MSGIPVVDLTRPVDRVADELDAACRRTGFFSVTGHGIDPALRDAAFEQCRRFFALPAAAKAAVASAGDNRGYDQLGAQRLDADAAVDRKESFMVGPADGANRWPELEGFRPPLLAYQAATRALAERLLRGIARALGLDERHFEPYHRNPILGLRLLRYPPRPPHAGALDFGAGAHTDWGAITVLAQDGVGSLQVEDPTGGWVDVDPDPDVYTINLGDLIEVWTNGHYRSTMHRVLGADEERYSLAAFCDLDADAVVACLPTCCGPDDPPRYAPTTVAEHLDRRYRESMLIQSPG